MLQKRELYLLTLLLIPIISWGENHVNNELARRAREVNNAMKKHSVLEPKDSNLDGRMACKLKSFFDPIGLLFTSEDLIDPAILKCYQGLCRGDTNSFEKMRTIAIRRSQELEKWLAENQSKRLDLHSNESIPAKGKWETTALDSTVLKQRWNAKLKLFFLEKLYQQKIDINDKTKVDAVQKQIFENLHTDLKLNVKDWENSTQEDIEDILLTSRIRCYDPYASLDSNKFIDDPSENERKTLFPGFIAAVKSSPSGNDAYEVVGLVPGTQTIKEKKVQLGDKIIKISVRDKSFDLTKSSERKHFQELPIPIGEEISITIQRDQKIKTVKLSYERSLKSSDVVLSKMYYEEGKKILYLQIPSFIDEHVVPGSDKAIATDSQVSTHLRNNSDADAIAIDLRSNPGGVVKSALNVAGALLTNGEELVTTLTLLKNRFGDYETVPTYLQGRVPNNQISKKPLFIFTNAQTGSSAETLTNILQEKQRAIVVGEPTYGKFIGQSLFELNPDESFYMTFSLFRRLQTDTLHGKGVEPDIPLPSLFSSSREKEKAELSQETTLALLKPVNLVSLTSPDTSPGKYFRRDPQIISRLKEEAKSELGENFGEYLSAIQTLKKLKEKPSRELNWLTFNANRITEDQNENIVIAKGGTVREEDELLSPSDITKLFLRLAARYSNEADKKKAERVTPSTNP